MTDAVRCGGEATKCFGEVFAPGFTKHADLDASVLQSPVATILLAAFPSDILAQQKESARDQSQCLLSKALYQFVDVEGVSAGWGLENDFALQHISGISERDLRSQLSGNAKTLQEKGSLFFALIGWGNENAATASRKTTRFKECVQLLDEMGGCSAVSTIAISCETLAREARERDNPSTSTSTVRR